MEIRPILASLRKHKLTATLLALQVAFTCAIVCNAAFLIVQRIERVTTPSGMVENTLSIVHIDDLGADANALSLHQGDVAALRQLPGVESAAIIDHVPFANSMDSTGICGSLTAVHAAMKARALVPGCTIADEYAGGPGMLGTLGLKLVAGRDFHADEYVPGKQGSGGHGVLTAVVITRALARRLFPHNPDHAIGRAVYFGAGMMHGQGTRIAGVIAQLHRASIGKADTAWQSMLLPVEPGNNRVTFALRSKPADRVRVMKEALALLAKRKPNRQISADDARTYTQIRATHFARDTTMVRLLLAAALGLLFVTALGIAGLASFWVGQRTRSIGIRRAIGATRRDILRYFQTENFLIVSVGIVVGLALAIGLNLLLMDHYELPRLPLAYLAVGAVALWILGQLAVLHPAMRAARVPPVAATRSA
ncbi:MAG TPA: FtsX-like permease family protein [Rhodanobacteraceae bacterium]